MRPLHTRPITGPTSMSKQDPHFFILNHSQRKTLTKECFQHTWPIKQRDKQGPHKSRLFMSSAEGQRGARHLHHSDSTLMHSHVLITGCIQLFQPSIRVIASIIQIMRYDASASSQAETAIGAVKTRFQCASDSMRWSNLWVLTAANWNSTGIILVFRHYKKHLPETGEFYTSNLLIISSEYLASWGNLCPHIRQPARTTSNYINLIKGDNSRSQPCKSMFHCNEKTVSKLYK
jgi:hypothetical protein